MKTKKKNDLIKTGNLTVSQGKFPNELEKKNNLISPWSTAFVDHRNKIINCLLGALISS